MSDEQTADPRVSDPVLASYIGDLRHGCDLHRLLLELQMRRAAAPSPEGKANGDDIARLEQLADRLSWPQPIREDLDLAIQAIHSYAVDLRADVPPVVTQWQPIENAPKDGSRILLAKIVGHIDHPTAIWWVLQGNWSLKWNKWWDGVEPCGLAGPTHWMPVPRQLASAKPARFCGACSLAEFGGPTCACSAVETPAPLPKCEHCKDTGRIEGGNGYVDEVCMDCDAAALALATLTTPDPLGCLKCVHPDCGRFKGPNRWECRAMADNACSRGTVSEEATR